MLLQPNPNQSFGFKFSCLAILLVGESHVTDLYSGKIYATFDFEGEGDTLEFLLPTVVLPFNVTNNILINSFNSHNKPVLTISNT